MTEARHMLALFDQSTPASEAIDAMHELGLRDDQIVVMTGVPFPERALGLHVEWLRLPTIVTVGAVAGFLFGIFLAVLTPHLYRLDVGGHPTVGFGPAAVIIFVFTMMATIISTFLGVLWELNFPEFGPKFYHREVTSGRLAVLVEHPAELENSVRERLQEHGGKEIQRAQKRPL
jgi:hypothetical protein